MKTPTHGLAGYAVARALGWTGVKCRHTVLGAVIPDVPVVMAGAIAAAKTVLETGSFEFAHFKAQMDRLYFLDPVLVFGHNFLHAPLNLALLAALAAIFLDARQRSPVLAFLAGAASHSIIDILSHVEDGPLLFWPLDSQIRFAGPFSHWEMGRGGIVMTLAECGLCLGALFVARAKRLPLRRAKRPR